MAAEYCVFVMHYERSGLQPDFNKIKMIETKSDCE